MNLNERKLTVSAQSNLGRGFDVSPHRTKGKFVATRRRQAFPRPIPFFNTRQLRSRLAVMAQGEHKPLVSADQYGLTNLNEEPGSRRKRGAKTDYFS